MCTYQKKSVPLGDLTRNLSYLASYHPSPKIPILGIAKDSRKVQPGFLFVAIRGYHEDGHRYIREAIRRGAVAIVSEGEKVLNSIPSFKVNNSRRALGELAGAFYNYPSQDLFLLGITGTNGKTTTAFMGHRIFKASGLATGLLGTVVIDDGERVYPSKLTTPDSLSLHQILYQMKERKVQTVVMEVSSQGLEQERVFGIDMHIGIFTNLTKEHLGYHQDFSSYKKAKAKFLDLFSPEKKFLYNKDDEGVCQLVKGAPPSLYSFSLEGKGDFLGKALTISKEGMECQFFFPGGEECKVFLKLLGRHNIYNALSAAAAAYLKGLPLHIIVQALNSFKPVTRRLELFQEDGILILDDTALNPASYQVVFETIRDLHYRDLVVVNAIRGQRGQEMNRANAQVLREGCLSLEAKKVIITSSRDYTGAMDEVTEEEEEIFLKELSPLSFLFYDDLKVAIQEALNQLKRGDLLLLLGAQGMDPGKEILVEKGFKKKKENYSLSRNK